MTKTPTKKRNKRMIILTLTIIFLLTIISLLLLQQSNNKNIANENSNLDNVEVSYTQTQTILNPEDPDLQQDSTPSQNPDNSQNFSNTESTLPKIELKSNTRSNENRIFIDDQEIPELSNVSDIQLSIDQKSLFYSKYYIQAKEEEHSDKEEHEEDYHEHTSIQYYPNIYTYNLETKTESIITTTNTDKDLFEFKLAESNNGTYIISILNNKTKNLTIKEVTKENENEKTETQEDIKNNSLTFNQIITKAKQKNIIIDNNNKEDLRLEILAIDEINILLQIYNKNDSLGSFEVEIKN